MNENDRGEQIRNAMRRIRREMGEDVEQLADSARQLTDWRSYVRSYPWLFVGGAMALGYLLVPRRRHIYMPPPPSASMPRKSSDWKALAWGAARNAALRAATSYATNAAATFLAAKTAIETSAPETSKGRPSGGGTRYS